MRWLSSLIASSFKCDENKNRVLREFFKPALTNECEELRAAASKYFRVVVESFKNKENNTVKEIDLLTKAKDFPWDDFLSYLKEECSLGIRFKVMMMPETGYGEQISAMFLSRPMNELVMRRYSIMRTRGLLGGYRWNMRWYDGKNVVELAINKSSKIKEMLSLAYLGEKGAVVFRGGSGSGDNRFFQEQRSVENLEIDMREAIESYVALYGKEAKKTNASADDFKSSVNFEQRRKKKQPEKIKVEGFFNCCSSDDEFFINSSGV